VDPRYIHSSGSPLQHTDIYSIAFEQIPTAAAAVFANAKCLQMTDTQMEDQSWRDVFGNSCDWYHKHRKQFPEICAGQDVRSNCPQACQSKFECYSNNVNPKAYFVWDRLKKIEAKHVNGTICLASKKDENDVADPARDARNLVEACRTWWKGRTDDLTTSWKDRMEADADIKKVSTPAGALAQKV
jgi:hypothetical protein